MCASKKLNILLSYDFIQELACNEDQHIYKHILDNYRDYDKANSFSFFTHLHVSKIRRRKAAFKVYPMFNFKVLSI